MFIYNWLYIIVINNIKNIYLKKLYFNSKCEILFRKNNKIILLLLFFFSEIKNLY